MKADRPEIIIWLDSHSPKGGVWIDRDEVQHGVLKIISVGYVIHESKKSVTIASSLTGKGSNQVSGVMTIPKCSITERETL